MRFPRDAASAEKYIAKYGAENFAENYIKVYLEHRKPEQRATYADNWFRNTFGEDIYDTCAEYLYSRLGDEFCASKDHFKKRYDEILFRVFEDEPQNEKIWPNVGLSRAAYSENFGGYYKPESIVHYPTKREYIIMVALGLGFTISETNDLLYYAGHSVLKNSIHNKRERMIYEAFKFPSADGIGRQRLENLNCCLKKEGLEQIPMKTK